jgi:flavonoid 3',5'-hydroxylase
MIVSLLTGAGLFNISDFVPALARLDLQGVQAKLRRIHLQFDALITKLLQEHAATAEERARQGRQDFVDRLRQASHDDDDEEGQTITEVNIKGLIFVSLTCMITPPSLLALLRFKTNN